MPLGHHCSSCIGLLLVLDGLGQNGKDFEVREDEVLYDQPVADFDAISANALKRPVRTCAAGEALFSDAEAKLLDRHGGLRRDRDVLVFDPVHCYGLPGYMRILAALEAGGWPKWRSGPTGGIFSPSMSRRGSGSEARR